MCSLDNKNKPSSMKLQTKFYFFYTEYLLFMVLKVVFLTVLKKGAMKESHLNLMSRNTDIFSFLRVRKTN